MMAEPRRPGLHACLQGFPGAVVELTPDGVVTDSNGRLEQLLGHDLVGRPFSDVLDPTSKHKWGSLLTRDATAVEGSLWELTIESREGLDSISPGREFARRPASVRARPATRRLTP